MGAKANEWHGAPIKADDEAKTGRLGKEDNVEGAPCRSFPLGCCQKRSSLRCKVSPGARPAIDFAPCAARFWPCNAFAPIALTGPSRLAASRRRSVSRRQLDSVAERMQSTPTAPARNEKMTA